MNLADMGPASSPYARQVYMGEAKLGKTTWLVASLLGALPHQKESVVSTPADLHLLGFDEAFADGLADFIVGLCKKPKEFLGVTVHPLTEARRKAGFAPGPDGNTNGWDYTFFNATQAAIMNINGASAKAHAAGRVSAVVVSSLTGLNEGLQMGLAGVPNKDGRGSGMDQSKWQSLENEVITLRNRLHTDTQHTLWEAHIMTGKKLVGGKEEFFEEIDAGAGKGGKHFGANVEFIFRLRREAAKHEGTAIDKCFVDTKPSMGTFSTGRRAQLLAEREVDMVEILKKLGKKTNGKPL